MPSKSIIVSAWSRESGNAKNYPYMQELCNLLSKEYRIIQIGIGAERKLSGCDCAWNLLLPEVETLLKQTGFFLAIDNFLHHMAYCLDVPGIVIWGPSDPELFGYKEQINIIKDRSLLRVDQFGFYRGEYKWPHADKGWYPADVIYNMGKL